MDERYYYVGFAVFSGIGPARFANLLEHFSSAASAWEARLEQLENVIGIAWAKKFIDFRERFDIADYIQQLEKKEVIFITSLDQEYPPLLKEISHPPYVLFVKGNTDLLKATKTIAIVGTRKITSYGQNVTTMLTQDLVSQEFVIVSGLALGVDGVAHATALEQKGKTIAVLGCGVDLCVPREHYQLYQDILDKGGTIVSTVPLGESAIKGSFPARNRIIAGLSQGVVVTEGAADSGSLITARLAKEMGRPVFAVPGPITSDLSKGANSLLQQGAIAVTKAEDVIHVILGSEATPESHQDKKGSGQARMIDVSKEEQQVLDMLQLTTLHIDEIIRKLGKSVQETGTLLSLMELKKLIKSDKGVYSLS